jgi:guanylate kinase
LNSAKEEQGIFIVISAPSGAGKTSICREFLKEYPRIRYSVSFTTRSARPGERDGKDYFFVSEEKFKEMVKDGEFAEWTEKFGYFYGTGIKTMRDFLELGNDLVLDIDTEGARNLKKTFPDGIYVFIVPPSLEELAKRLLRRGSESKADLERRLEKARDEINEVFWYNYIIINDDIHKAIEQMKAIYVAEKSRRERNLTKIQRIFRLEV